MIKRVSFMLAVLAVIQIGFAQEVDPSNYEAWFSNPALAIAAVAGFVQWLRRVRPGIDGPWLVPGVALLAGAIGGALGQMGGLLAVQPFMSISFPLGGILYGLAAAVGAVFGVNLFEMLSSKLGRALVGFFRSGDETVDPDSRDTAASGRLRR